jgi:hypothetical protein
VAPRHPRSPLPVECLVALAEIAEARLASADGERDGPSLLRVRVVGDEVELGWRALDGGVHPVDELLGTRVPRTWAAVGVAAHGWAHHLARAGDPPHGAEQAVRVRTVHLVGRDGAWASRWTAVDDEGTGCSSSGTGLDERCPAGRVDDACRRTLGLPTSPPRTGTGELWAMQWLDAIAERAARGERSLPWPVVASLHPAVPALWTLDGRPPTPPELARLADQLTAWRDWSALRRACAAGTWAVAGVPAHVAGWLDDGAFARLVLAEYPELVDLVAIVAGVLAAPVADLVADTLAAGAGDHR